MDTNIFKLERHPAKSNMKKASDKTLKTLAKSLDPTHRNRKLEINCSE